MGPNTAGIMLTNPSTCGVFERRIKEVAKIVHDAGGLLYYDGANLNAILGKVRPGDMGFDVIHMNLHKTFSTPHGGGGPGAGAVGVGARLLPFMPIPVVRGGKDGDTISLALGKGPAAVHRPSVGLHGQCRRAAARIHIYAHARSRRHASCRRIRDAERQLSDGTAREGGIRPRVSEAARQPRIHRHREAAGPRSRRDRHGHRQAAAGLRLPCAHDVFPAAGARMPADRADGNREQGSAGWLHRCDGRHPEGSRIAGRFRQVRTAHHDGAPARRRSRGASARSHLETGGGLRRETPSLTTAG